MKERELKERGRARRWQLFGVSVLVLALAGLYVYGKQLYSESRSVLAFVDALQREDAARLAQSLREDRGGAPIDEARVRKLLDYLAENNLIDEAVAGLQRGYEGPMADGRLFAVVKDGKHFGVYDRYRIAVATSEADVMTNFKGTDIKLDGETVATADSDEFSVRLGPLLPGSYKLEAVYDGEYAHMRAEQTMLVRGDEGLQTIDLLLDGGLIQVDANYENASIYIDGKNTGAVTGSGERIGPVALDGSNRVLAELAFPWGMAGSAPMPIDSETIRVHIDPNTDAMKQAVMAAVSDFIRSWSEAYNKLDPSLVAHLSEDRRAELVRSIEEYKAHGLVYEAQERKLLFDTGSIYVQQDEDGAYTTAASLQRTYVSRYYGADELPPPMEAYTDTMTYRLVFSDGDWTVTDWYEEYHFNPAHTKEWSFPFSR